ncbi:Uncharacterised protein [Staphylococcus aureus]|nr:Uncharacterised protein [Staphylococcus aureus]
MSAILTAIYPASIGTINLKAKLPMFSMDFQNESSGMTNPFDVVSPPRVSAMAIRSPPTTIKGTINDTPFIKC